MAGWYELSCTPIDKYVFVLKAAHLKSPNGQVIGMSHMHTTDAARAVEMASVRTHGYNTDVREV